MEQRSVFTLMTVLLQLNNLKKNSIHRCASSITMYRNILYHDTYRIVSPDYLQYAALLINNIHILRTVFFFVAQQ